MSFKINSEKAFENQLTRRIDELNSDNGYLSKLLLELSGITLEVLTTSENTSSFIEWHNLIMRVFEIYSKATKYLETKTGITEDKELSNAKK